MLNPALDFFFCFFVFFLVTRKIKVSVPSLAAVPPGSRRCFGRLGRTAKGRPSGRVWGAPPREAACGRVWSFPPAGRGKIWELEEVPNLLPFQADFLRRSPPLAASDPRGSV